MALIQISDPDSSSREQQRYAAGIDLGTTNSLVGAVLDSEVRVLADDRGQKSLPSAVRYLPDGTTVVGQQALDAEISDSANVIVSAKRLLGRNTEELQSLYKQYPYQFVRSDKAVVQIQTVAGVKTPIEVSAEILKILSERTRQVLDWPALDGVVITVPAYFDDAQRQATKDAARLADLEVLRLLNEPTAAAVAYGLDREQAGIIVVFDLGGGTFDVSVLNLDKGVFRVLATAGDTALGGDDFDQLIAEYIVRERHAETRHEDVYDPRSWRMLRRQACVVKEALSSQNQVQFSVQLPDGESWEQSLSRDQMNRVLGSLVDKTIFICRRAVRDAGIQLDDVREIVMVGGSTRIPLVQAQVAKLFGRNPLTDINPDEVVAVGAAIQADILIGNKPDNDMLLLDVTPLSLGIETMGGLVEKIIPRNTAIPVARAQEFTTYKDGQTGMSIHVVQGERELVDDCRSLAKFELKGIPPMVAGAARINVTFQVSADGLLTVEAKEMTQGIIANVEVRPAYGLTDDEIEIMLKESLTHADDDIHARKLKEQQIAARQVLESLSVALSEDADQLLGKAEYNKIMQTKKQLETVIDGNNADLIREKIRVLEADCEEYVERRMNQGIAKAMRGRTVDEFQ